MDSLIKVLNRYPNGTELLIKWDNGLVIKGAIDTIYETNNGLDIDNPEYEEYDACLFLVNKIYGNRSMPNTRVGSLIDISCKNPPVSICLLNGTKIWGNE